MAPRLPSRYRLDVRLGRDGDVEEWLGIDTELDRPVVIRYLGPSAGEERMAAFLAAVRAAASVSHPHVQRIYAAGSGVSGAWAVAEWDGAVTIADRLRAGEALPVAEFLPNAVGLADGLAALHAAGAVHGAIDPSALHFSAAHPARLGGFGRRGAVDDPVEDVRALADALRVAVTGDPAADAAPPSQVVEGLPSEVDDTLERAAAGLLDAAGLADALRSIPTPPERPRDTWRPRLLVLWGVLAAAVVLVGAAGLALDVDRGPAFLYPANPAPVTVPPPRSTTTTAPTRDDTRLDAIPSVYDPLGDGVESDDLVGGTVDGDPDVGWSTEAYSRPLREIKAGVGVVFQVEGRPSQLRIVGTPGTVVEVLWADRIVADPAGWEPVATATLLPTGARLPLPQRDGVWLLWLTRLPRDDDTYRAELGEVRFLR